MNPQLRRLILDFGPLLILFGVNKVAGIFAATAAFMVAITVTLAIGYALERKISPMPLFTAVLVLIFGGLTLYLKNDIFIKMKPTVLYAGFGVALIGGLAMNKPVLSIVFDNAMALTERGWRLLTLRWGGFFFALALLNEIVWRTQSNDAWVAFKFPGIFILILLFSGAQVPLVTRHKLPDDEAEDAPDHY